MDIGLYIDGQWRSGAGRRSFQAHDPMTGESVTTAFGATSADVTDAVDAAHRAFDGWAATAPGVRRRLLDDAADSLEDRRTQLRELITRECGGTRAWGDFNVSLAAGLLREAGARAYDAAGGTILSSDVPGLSSRAVRRPRGVAVGIAPWNAPVILGVRALATPLATGNTVILKSAERSPGTHAAIVSAIAEAGFAPGVLNFLSSHPSDAGEIVGDLIAHPAVRSINFTGSTHVGRIIAVKAAEHLKHTVLELGGKASLIVLDDADLDAAVDAAVFGSFMNAGQICMSTERVIVADSLADDFTRRLAERAEKLRSGDPRDDSTEVGPMIDSTERDRVVGLIEDARSKGAEVVAGGELVDGQLRPTVVKDVTPQMRLYATESFGPVVSVIRSSDDADALRIANDTPYGLTAAVFSTDLERAERVAAQVDSGICHVNSATVHDEAQAPFGGVKDSGWGRFGGDAGIAEFTTLTWNTVQHGGRHYPI